MIYFPGGEGASRSKRKQKGEKEKKRKRGEKGGATGRKKTEKKKGKKAKRSSSSNLSSTASEMECTATGDSDTGSNRSLSTAASGTSDSSSSSSDDGWKKSRKGKRRGVDWELLEDLWPIEDRPRRLKEKRAVKGMSMGQLMRIKEQYEKENEKKGLGSAVYGRDKKPKAKKFKAQKDDGEKKLHPARFESLPRVAPAKFWKHVPTGRSEVYRHLPLQHLGVDGVAESTIVKLHNRKVPVELAMLRKEPVAEVRHVEQAVWNYVLILRSLHPADHGGLVLHKVIGIINNNTIHHIPTSAGITRLFNYYLGDGGRRLGGDVGGQREGQGEPAEEVL